MTQEPKARTIRVLVVDDSSFMRIALTRVLQADTELEVVGCARDGRQAVEMTAELRPDVVTMDVEMPRMSGLEALKEIMARWPRPVIMVSSMTQEGAQMTFDALDLGAFDYIPKQIGARSLDVEHLRRDLIAKVKAAFASRRRELWSARAAVDEAAREKGTRAREQEFAAPSVICVGSSTGGPRALQQILPRLPAELAAGVVVVQHMPQGFTAPFAARLNGMCSVRVKEAEQDDWVDPGIVLIAPATWHITIFRRSLSRYAVRLSKTPGNLLHIPSVDVMMTSAAEVLAERTMGVILTGMGNDGEAGMKAIHDGGGYTIGQDEASCAVYGMPKACAQAGALDKVLPLTEIADEIASAANACYA